MKADEYKHIEILLERFFEGGTTNAEEQELYAFFSGTDLPGHLEAYRPVFGYFAAGIAREAEEQPLLETPRRPAPLKKWLWTGMAAAASLSLLLFLSKGGGGEAFNPYDGSYVVRDGVRTEIPEAKARELDRAIREAGQNLSGRERLATRAWLAREEEAARLEREMELLETKYEE